MPCQTLSALTIIALLVGSSHADDPKHFVPMEEIREVDERPPESFYLPLRASSLTGNQAIKSSNLRNDNIGYVLQLVNKHDDEFEIKRSVRSPLGTMRFGKRSNPLGTMRFGKRQPYLEVDQFDKRDAPLGTMRFGRRR